MLCWQYHVYKQKAEARGKHQKLIKKQNVKCIDRIGLLILLILYNAIDNFENEFRIIR